MSPASTASTVIAVAIIGVILVTIGLTTGWFIRDLFRQTAQLGDRSSGRQKMAISPRPAPPHSHTDADGLRWSALDDLQLARLLGRSPAARSRTRNEAGAG